MSISLGENNVHWNSHHSAVRWESGSADELRFRLLSLLLHLLIAASALRPLDTAQETS